MAAVCHTVTKHLQLAIFFALPASEMGLIAMQKVVGSNPISRFFENALHVGGLGSARVAETEWNHPRASPSFWALVPKPAQICAAISGDFGRFRLALAPQTR